MSNRQSSQKVRNKKRVSNLSTTNTATKNVGLVNPCNGERKRIRTDFPANALCVHQMRSVLGTDAHYGRCKTTSWTDCTANTTGIYPYTKVQNKLGTNAFSDVRHEHDNGQGGVGQTLKTFKAHGDI